MRADSEPPTSGAFRNVADLATYAGVGSGETSSGELFAEVVDLFALGEGVEENGHCSHVHRANADSEHVGGDTGKLTAEDAQGSLATIAGDADVGTCDDEDEPETEDEKSEDDDLCSSDDG